MCSVGKSDVLCIRACFDYNLESCTCFRMDSLDILSVGVSLRRENFVFQEGTNPTEEMGRFGKHLPNSLAHRCSRITSILFSESHGGQMGEGPGGAEGKRQF